MYIDPCILYLVMKTPQQSYSSLAAAIGVPELYFKREDLHKYGSHKGRSIPHMIKKYAKEGIADFVISSSGNAALAAIHATIAHNQNNPGKEIKLTVFVGAHIPKQKLDRLQSLIIYHLSFITIQQVDRPKQSAIQFEKEHNAKFLRQSTDDLALEGYFELAEELHKIPNLEAIFIPTSSGTTAHALGVAFQTLSQKPQIHIVQTTACHPIAEVFDGEQEEAPSIAGAIVDKVAHRKEKVVEIIKNSGGSGWIVNDQEISNAIRLVKECANMTISANSALSVAGLQKAVRNGWKWTLPRRSSEGAEAGGVVLCIITGL